MNENRFFLYDFLQIYLVIHEKKLKPTIMTSFGGLVLYALELHFTGRKLLFSDSNINTYIYYIFAFQQIVSIENKPIEPLAAQVRAASLPSCP